MKKIYESNGLQSENPFDINLVKENGELEDYYLIAGETREKITLRDLINKQVMVLKKPTENDNNSDYAKIGSIQDWMKIGSSEGYAKIATSGYSAQIGSSGYSAKMGSSGDWAQIASSGNSAKIGSSGNSARIGSSGNSVQIGLSGDHSKITTSGDYTQIGSSGNCTQININGKNSIGFVCGYDSSIKAKNGTWISLAEWGLVDERYIPVFALSAQIGNENYKDFKGKVLSEDKTYMLIDKQFKIGRAHV